MDAAAYSILNFWFEKDYTGNSSKKTNSFVALFCTIDAIVQLELTANGCLLQEEAFSLSFTNPIAFSSAECVVKRIYTNKHNLKS